MKLFSKLILVAASLMAFGACSDSDSVDNGGNNNNLAVTPSKEIKFHADGNSDVKLTVKTDAKSWTYETTEWVIASKEGNTLSVNAEANTSEAERTGYVTVKAGDATPVKIKVSQAGAVAGEITLSVTPSDAIAFEATGNKAVELTVKTNAKGWTYTYPDAWVTVSKEGDKLSVNAKDNTAAAREGEIVIKTSEGDKQVKIAVSQKSGVVVGNKAKVTFAYDNKVVNFKDNATAERVLTFTLDHAVEAEAKLKVTFDALHVAESNIDNNTNYETFPESQVKMENDGVVTIAVGQTTATMKVTLTSGSLQHLVTYMVPLMVESQSAAVTVDAAHKYADLLASKVSDKKIRNICYFEVNDVNPLNALEYVLEDGQPFFDAVVLFAGNINWNGSSERVYMKANPNVQALFDNSESLLQPLRKKGIKVLLGILGNHDAAGLAGLTDYGCQEFAKELAQYCVDYQLDGVAFDEEYSKYQYAPTKWFIGNASEQAAARLCYETKKAMTEKVPWETWLHLYYMGYIRSNMPSVNVDGKTYQPGEFIDNVCADYRSSAVPVAGMSLDRCAGASIQLNFSHSISSADAKGYMDKGYGWIMWFAFNPAGSGNTGSNLQHSLEQFRNVASGCYNKNVLAPKYVYAKKGEGLYDATPQPVQ